LSLLAIYVFNNHPLVHMNNIILCLQIALLKKLVRSVKIHDMIYVKTDIRN